jgi:hypothetical protein
MLVHHLWFAGNCIPFTVRDATFFGQPLRATSFNFLIYCQINWLQFFTPFLGVFMLAAY